ncbi:calcium-binding protein [Streptomyces hirsutus]|uniref:calcium-binding protein n=1 Tax=Streptomyces hirsutus TaxID=35620 RepID=UPI00367B8E17
MRTNLLRSGSLAAAVIVQMVCFAGPAHAAPGGGQSRLNSTVVSKEHDQELYVQAAGGKVNTITIIPAGIGDAILISDSGDTLSPAPGSGCARLPGALLWCATAGIYRVSVNAGDRNDTITNHVSIPVSLNGGAGDDTINAGAGRGLNHLWGGRGNDTLNGSPNTDWLDGGTGADILNGGAGTDRATYSERAARVVVDLDNVADDGVAGEHDNVKADVEEIVGGSENDILTGSNRANRLYGLNGNDVLNGLGGPDVLDGGAGADLLDGGYGNDFAHADSSPDGRDRFVGGSGVDEASYGLRTTAVNVTLNGVADDGASGEGDNIGVDVENITGGSENDILTGNAAGNTLVGYEGNDTLNGLAGLDRLNGEDGRDTLDGGDDTDVLNGGNGNDVLNGGNGNDSLLGGPGPIRDPDGVVEDTDALNGGPGTDTATYVARSAGLVVDLDDTPDDGQPGENDDVRSDVENIIGGDGNDDLTGNSAANTLNGGPGNDTLRGADGISGNDTVNGGIHTDSCTADTGDNRINCES